MHTYMHTYIQTDRQTDRQTDKQTDRQTDRQTNVHGYGYNVCMHKLSNFDQADLCCAHQSTIQVHPSVLGMSFNSQHQWVSVSTIHGNLVRVLVHPGMQILDFKDKCFEEDLWSGTPISLLTPLAINVDLAAMMSEGKQVTDPRPWQMKGRYNRFRLCTKDGDLLDDEDVLQEDMLTNCKLFKVQWMKQFNLRVEEEASLVQCMTSEQHVVSFDMTFNHNTSFRAFPFYGNEGQFHGLVYQHSEIKGHCESQRPKRRR